MQMIKPITVDNTALEASNVTEDDYSEWASGTTYAADDFVIVIGTTHKVYQSVQNANTGNNPTTDDGTWWTEISATNRWKAFDSKLSDQVENADEITYSLRIPSGGLVSGVAAFNVEADTVEVSVEDDTNYVTPDAFAFRINITLNDDDGPVPGSQADKFAATTDNDTHYKEYSKDFVSGQAYTISTHVKADGYNYARLTLPDAAFTDFHEATFNLNTGTVADNLTGATAGIEAVGNGFYRIWLTSTADATVTANARVQMEIFSGPSFAGNGTLGILVYGTTLEAASTPAGVVYYQSNTAVASSEVDDWYSYFYGAFDQSSETLFLDQPSFQSMPGYEGYIVHVAANRPGGTAKVGQIVLGRLFSLGRTVKPGTSVTAQDFSVKGNDDFGNAILTQRGFSKEVDFSFVFPTDGAQRVDKIITDVRATPVVWLAGPGTSQYATTVYGWWEDYDLALEGKNSPARLRIKGLV